MLIAGVPLQILSSQWSSIKLVIPMLWMDEIHFAPPFRSPGVIRFPCKSQPRVWFQPWLPSAANWTAQYQATDLRQGEVLKVALCSCHLHPPKKASFLVCINGGCGFSCFCSCKAQWCVDGVDGVCLFFINSFVHIYTCLNHVVVISLTIVMLIIIVISIVCSSFNARRATYCDHVASIDPVCLEQSPLPPPSQCLGPILPRFAHLGSPLVFLAFEFPRGALPSNLGAGCVSGGFRDRPKGFPGCFKRKAERIGLDG